MNGQNTGPIINSRHHNNLPKNNKGVFIVAAIAFILVLAGSFLFVIEKDASHSDEFLAEELMNQEMLLNEIEELQNITNEEIEEPTSAIESKEEGSADFFYQRALKHEKEKKYEEAVKDYTLTINKAGKYSAEMWNALNNRGIINAKQFKDYKTAIKDFNKIIEIETNRRDGNVNAIRLEAGYTNRAYVKNMQGNKTGACDDLYEALYLGVESSQKFIQQQIDKNCL